MDMTFAMFFLFMVHNKKWLNKNQYEYITDISQYHNAGISSMDWKILSFMFQTVLHTGESVIIPL